MNEDETIASSSSTTSYAGKYEIRRNDSHEPTSGSVIVRQEGDHLVLEKFSLIPGSHYQQLMEEVIKGTKEPLHFATEDRRIANFVLSALPTEVIPLRFLGKVNGIINYGAKTSFGELDKIWTGIEGDKTLMHVYFKVHKSSYSGDTFYLSVESPYAIGNPSMAITEEFRLFKVGSAEHDRLLRPWPVPAARSE